MREMFKLRGCAGAMLIGAAVWASLPAGAQGAAPASASAEASAEAVRFIEYYAQKPEPKKVGQMLAALEGKAGLDDAPMQALLSSFIGQLSCAHGDELAAWSDAAVKGDTAVARAYVIGLGTCHSPKAIAEIQRLFKSGPEDLSDFAREVAFEADTRLRYQNLGAVDLMKDPFDSDAGRSSRQVGALWGHFFATGDENAVKKLAQGVGTNTPAAQEIERTLEYRSFTHAKVLAVVKAEALAGGSNRAALEAIAARAEARLSKEKSPDPSLSR